MEFLNSYDTLWTIYLTAVAVLGLSGYLILRSLPLIWLRWVLLVSLMIFLVSPVKVNSDGWMVPGALYWLFERFFIQNPQADSVFSPILMNLAVGIIVTTLLWFGARLLTPSLGSSKLKERAKKA